MTLSSALKEEHKVGVQWLVCLVLAGTWLQLLIIAYI